jgi:hypothetical protein
MASGKINLTNFNCENVELFDRRSSIIIFIALNGNLVRYKYYPHKNTVPSFEAATFSEDFIIKDLCRSCDPFRKLDIDPGIDVDVFTSFFLSYSDGEFFLEPFTIGKNRYEITEFNYSDTYMGENFANEDEMMDIILEDITHYLRIISFKNRVPNNTIKIRMDNLRESVSCAEYSTKIVHYSRKTMEEYFRMKKYRKKMILWRFVFNKNIKNNAEKYYH